MRNADDTGESKMTDATIGTRIFNGGDMANVPHWGTIIQVNHDENWGTSYVIRIDETDDVYGIDAYSIASVQLGDVYAGNGLTRIVTEAAYLTWHAAKVAELEAALPSRYHREVA